MSRPVPCDLGSRGDPGTAKTSRPCSRAKRAVVKDPVQDRVVWLEYLETVVKERDGWKDLYRSCKEVL